MTITLAIIVAAAAIVGALLKAGTAVVAVVRAWSADVAGLRVELAAVRVELATTRGDIRGECWDMIRGEAKVMREGLAQHRRDCREGNP